MPGNEITVTARRWAHGWELVFGEDDAAQVRSLSHAQSQVRDYLDTIEPEIDHSDVKVVLVPDAGAEEIQQARRARLEAERSAAEAVEQVHEVVAGLR